MPEAPPVTSAVFPVRSAVIMAMFPQVFDRRDCVAAELLATTNESHGEHGGKKNRHPGEGRDPPGDNSNAEWWAPVFAGMTGSTTPCPPCLRGEFHKWIACPRPRRAASPKASPRVGWTWIVC